jgi:hypothetical protein
MAQMRRKRTRSHEDTKDRLKLVARSLFRRTFIFDLRKQSARMLQLSLSAFVPSCSLYSDFRLTALAIAIRWLPDWHRTCIPLDLALPLSCGKYYGCNVRADGADGTTFAFDSSKDRAQVSISQSTTEKLGAKNHGKNHWN